MFLRFLFLKRPEFSDDDHFPVQPQGNLYVHHDVLLTDFPLCLSWMGCSTAGDNGSYVAVGSFDPAIEVWNLDEMDPVEPICLLGSPGHEQKAAQATRSGSKKKVKKGPKGTKVRLWNMCCCVEREPRCAG